MYRLERTKAFDRDVKRFVRKGGDVKRLQQALEYLESGSVLPASFRDHQLKGRLRKCREIHIEPDWLLVYEKDGKQLRIVCLWLLSHNMLKKRRH